MYKNNVEVVISRYNEDLKWINEYPFNQFEYIVYNKGINDNFEKNNIKKIVNLDNVGTCDHTYLYHIIENYANLSNIIVLLPGSINTPNKKPKAIKLLEYIIKSNYKKAFFLGTYCNDIKNTFRNFTLNEWEFTTKQNSAINTDKKLQLCKLRPYGKWYNYFFGNTCAHWYTFLGIFSIDKRDIIQHSITRYQHLISTVNMHHKPEAAHYIERSWGAIFYPLVHTNKVKYEDTC
jgi:hypothetical protein